MAYLPGPRSDIEKKEMANGLVLISEVMPCLHSVSVGLWVTSGSRFEAAALGGISHFIEHLLFKGTASRSAGEIAREIDSVGGQLDAFTDKEFVCAYARVMDRHLPVAFEILSDIVLNPAFPPVEVKRERNVVFEEINALEDSPQDLVHDLYLEGLWPDHPLGRPVAGTKDSVAGISRADVVRFFRKHYCARNMVMSVAGNIRHPDVRRLAGRYFGELAPGEAADPGPPPRVRPARIIRDKDHLEQVHICLGTPCPALTSRARFAAHLLSTILGGGMSSRLFQNIREKRGLVYSIEASLSLFRDAGTLVVSAAVAPETAAAVVELILKELKKLRENPVSSEELKRAKDFVTGAFLLGLESSSSRMTHLAQQQIYFGRTFTARETIDHIEGVKAYDIRRLADEIFHSAGIMLTALGSSRRPELESVALRI